MTEQRKNIAVFTRDRYLFQKIRLELYHCAHTVLCEKAEDAKDADLILTDIDCAEFRKLSGTKMTRHGAQDGEISIPFPIGRLTELIEGEKEKLLTVCESERCAILNGKRIRLTEVEFALLDLLIKNDGGFVSREILLEKIWNNSADSGVINVYVHYLREKLETDGEKIIISSRKHGYRISEKFLGGRNA